LYRFFESFELIAVDAVHISPLSADGKDFIGRAA
jgi:hypothetical protein